MTQTQRFHIYCWYRDIACTKPFYIGKGLKNRESHWRDMRRNKNLRLLAAVAEVLTEHGSVPTKILQTSLTHEQAIEAEMRLIHEIGRFPNGPLLNITRGGVGGPFTPEQAVAHSLKMKGRKVVNKGVPMSEEQKAKLKEAWARRKEYRDEIMKQIGEAKRGKPAHNKGKAMSEEQRRKLREAWEKNPGPRATNESRAKMSEAAKQLWQDPAYREANRTAVQRGWTDERRATQAAKTKAAWKRRRKPPTE